MGKEEQRRRSADNRKGKRKGGRRKGREQRTVVYSTGDAATNPPCAPRHSCSGHFSGDQTYLRLKDQYFSKQMWRDTQRYVAGCDLCHRTIHQSGNPMGLLHQLPIAKGHSQRMTIDFITDLPVSGIGHDCIVTFVDHMTKRAHW